MAGMQNTCVIRNTDIECTLKSVKVCVLEMSGSGGSWKGTGPKRKNTVAESSITKAVSALQTEFNANSRITSALSFCHVNSILRERMRP